MTPLVDSKGAAIDEILEKLGMAEFQNGVKSTKDIDPGVLSTATNEAKQAILAILAQEVKRVIGEDEFTMGDADDFGKMVRNKFRAEQRRKAGLV